MWKEGIGAANSHNGLCSEGDFGSSGIFVETLAAALFRQPDVGTTLPQIFLGLPATDSNQSFMAVFDPVLNFGRSQRLLRQVSNNTGHFLWTNGSFLYPASRFDHSTSDARHLPETDRLCDNSAVSRWLTAFITSQFGGLISSENCRCCRSDVGRRRNCYCPNNSFRDLHGSSGSHNCCIDHWNFGFRRSAIRCSFICQLVS